MQRNFVTANKTIDRALELNPNGIGLWEMKVKLAIAEKADFSVYEPTLEKNEITADEQGRAAEGCRRQADLLLFQRKYQQVLQLARVF